MDMQIEDPGPTQEQVEAHMISIPQDEPEYVLGSHGELRRRYPKHQATVKPSKRRHHGKKK